ncbi:MAG: hypothetical protein FWD15_01680 [Alphaproteobacteria bacterium]|nr:hypothetical protein [Alphaproteobacteria bacterium]
MSPKKTHNSEKLSPQMRDVYNNRERVLKLLEHDNLINDLGIIFDAGITDRAEDYEAAMEHAKKYFDNFDVELLKAIAKVRKEEPLKFAQFMIEAGRLHVADEALLEKSKKAREAKAPGDNPGWTLLWREIAEKKHLENNKGSKAKENEIKNLQEIARKRHNESQSKG